jgi:hypothetical protein
MNHSKRGLKFDNGKPPLSLVPKALLEGVAWTLGFGANKYGRDNYKQGFKYTRLADAVFRHMVSAVNGEDNDPESGRLHLEHAAATLAMMLECNRLSTLEDDRYEHGETQRAQRIGVSTRSGKKTKSRKQGLKKRARTND